MCLPCGQYDNQWERVTDTLPSRHAAKEKEVEEVVAWGARVE